MPVFLTKGNELSGGTNEEGGYPRSGNGATGTTRVPAVRQMNDPRPPPITDRRSPGGRSRYPGSGG
jgi:hypothetical protein